MTLRASTNLVANPDLTMPRSELKSGFLYVYGKGYAGLQPVFMTKLWASTLFPKLAANPAFGKDRRGVRGFVEQFTKTMREGLTDVRKIQGTGDEGFFRISVPMMNVNPADLASTASRLQDYFLTSVPAEQLHLEDNLLGIQDNLISSTNAEGKTIGRVVYSGAEVIRNVKGLDSKATIELSNTLEALRIETHGNTGLIFLDFKISARICQQLTNIPFVEIRPIDMYPLISQWVANCYGYRGETPLSSFPVSKIARTLPQVAEGDARINENNLSIGPDGTAFWLPEKLDNTGRYEDLFNQAGMQDDGGFRLDSITDDPEVVDKVKLPANIPVLIDWVNNKYSYTTTTGGLKVQDLTRFKTADHSHIYNIMTRTGIDIKTTNTLFNMAYKSGVNTHIQLTAEEVQEMNTVLPGSGDALLKALDDNSYLVKALNVYRLSEEMDPTDPIAIKELSLDGSVYFRPIVRILTQAHASIIQNLDAVNLHFAVSTVSTHLALLTLIAKYGADFSDVVLKSNAIRSAATNQGVDPSWQPPSIPLLSDKIGMLPHQLKVRNLLKDSPDFAILPVQAGGGKSVLAITDVLYEIKANRSKPYLILCPPHLVAQYVKEIVYFTAGQLNVITINSYSIRRNGLERLTEMVEHAPRNSVVVCDYDILRQFQQAVCYGTTTVPVYPVIEFLRQFRFGYCLTGDARLYTNEGVKTLKQLYIEASFKKGSTLKYPDAVYVRGMHGEYKIDRIGKRKSKRLKITTRFGYELKGSPEHPVRILDEKMRLVWRNFEDLKEGDLLCIDTKSQYFPTTSVSFSVPECSLDIRSKVLTMPTKGSVSLSRFLGYYVSEGNRETCGIRFTNFDSDLIDEYAQLIRNLFEVEPTFYNNTCIVNSKHIVHFMEYLEVGKNSYEQVIPWVVLQGTKEEQAGFLQTYFEGDGDVNGFQITARSVSKKLIHQLQTILLNFGIVSQICRGMDWNDKWTYTINIRQEFRDIFRDEIGFISKRKMDSLDNLIESGVQTGSHHYVPQFRDLIRRFTEKYRFSANGIYMLPDGSRSKLRPFNLKCGMDQKGEMHYSNIVDTVDMGIVKRISVNANKILQDITESGFYFDPVKCIKPLSDGYVYNITVPETETFVANGILTHNCLLDESHSVKNNTARTRACMALISDIPKKRLASGTMAHDSPSDLALQIAMLDPTLFGSREAFNERYGEKISGDRVLAWKPGAQQQIMAAIKSRVVVAGAMRKEWAALLPHAHERFVPAVLTDAQRDVYDTIFAQTEEEIREMAKSNATLAKFLAEGPQPSDEEVDPNAVIDEDEGGDIASVLGPYLARLEQFLCAPARDKMGDEMLRGSDRVSPKIAAIEMCIREHLDRNLPGKILIFTNYTASAEEIYENLSPEIKAQTILYRAADKVETGNKFENDPRLKIMVGVENSMNTGLNFQHCFPEYTPVLVDHDTSLTIKDVYDNDDITHVLSYDLDSRKIEKRKILRKIRTPVIDEDNYVSVKVRDNATGVESSITCTDNHPFILKGGDEVHAGDLEVGSQLITYGGTFTRGKIDPVFGNIVAHSKPSLEVSCNICEEVMHTHALLKHQAKTHGINKKQYKEQRLIHSEASKRNWEDEEFRENHSESMRNFFATDEGREVHARVLEARWSKPNAKEKHSARLRKQWKDPEYKQRVGAAISKALSALETRMLLSQNSTANWAKEEYRDKIAESIEAYWSIPKHHKERSRISKEMWKDPEVRKRALKGLAQANARPERIQARRDEMSKRHEDPRYTARTVGAMLRAQGELPNKPERNIIDLDIEGLRYTGDGNYFISLEREDGTRWVKNPDFISENHLTKKGRTRRVVEVIGAREYTGRDEAYDEELIAAYARKGIECLILDAEDCYSEEGLDEVHDTLESFINNHYLTVLRVQRNTNSNSIGKYKYDLEVAKNHNFFVCTTKNQGGRSGYIPVTPILVHNCSRLIRCETVWNPGTLEQGNSRVNRPELKKTEERSQIFYDWIIVDRTIDVTKISRLVAKVVAIGKFENTDSTRYQAVGDIPVIPMTLKSVKHLNSWNENLGAYAESFKQYKQAQQDDYDDYKEAYKAKYGELRLSNPLSVAEIPVDAALMTDITYTPGLDIYKASELGLIRVDEYLRLDESDSSEDDTEGEEAEAALESGSSESRKRNALLQSLVGQKVHTEYGDGIIKSASSGSKLLNISLPTGYLARVKFSAAFLITKPVHGTVRKALFTEVKTIVKVTAPLKTMSNRLRPDTAGLRKAEKEKIVRDKMAKREAEKKAQEVAPIEISFSVSNGFLGVTYFTDDGNTAAANVLQGLGFRATPKFAFAEMKTAPHLYKQFSKWKEAGFTLDEGIRKAGISRAIADLHNLLKANKLKSRNVNFNFSTRNQLKNFYRSEMKPSTSTTEFKPYPMIEDGVAYLVLPLRGQPASKAAMRIRVPGVKWQLSPDSLVYHGLDLAATSAVIKKILAAGIQISNIKDLKADFRRLHKTSLRKNDDTSII